MDCFTEIITVLEIDFEYGDFLEINSSWIGFQNVVESIKNKLPKLEPNIFERARQSCVAMARPALQQDWMDGRIPAVNYPAPVEFD